MPTAATSSISDNQGAVRAPALSRAMAKELASNWALFFAALIVAECLVYFSNPGHFFTGDSLFWFEHRMRTLPEFLWSFVERDPAGWYRPLTNRALQSLLYPILGLKPTLYHVLLVPFVFLERVAVFALTYVLTRRPLAAAFATLFFSLHTLNAYLTYDLAFFVEMVYPFFYIVGAIAVVHYIQSGRSGARWISLASYAMALLSKEAAVTLPATAAVLCWLESDRKGLWNRAKHVLSGVGLHFALMTVYMIFVIGYIHVGTHALDDVLTEPPQDGDYHVVFGKHIFTNLDFAFTWAFNIPRGWHTDERDLAPWMMSFLNSFRGITLMSAAMLLLIPRRRILLVGTNSEKGGFAEWCAFVSGPKPVIAGIAWFAITLTPMLTLFDHFVPCYLTLPVAGFSVLVGASFDGLFVALKSRPRFRTVAFTAMFIGLAVVCIHSSWKDIDRHPLMGGFAVPAGRNLAQVQERYPIVQPGTTFYFLDDEYPALQVFASPSVFRVAYNDDTLQVKHSAAKDRVTQADIGEGKLLAFKAGANGKLTDITAEVKANPARFMTAE